MDAHMPIMDGVTDIETLRKKGYTGMILMLTASVYSNEVEKAYHTGANYFIGKLIGDSFEDLVFNMMKEEHHD